MSGCACGMRSFGGGKITYKRKAPETPSKNLRVGTVMMGKDKKQWIVKKYKNGVRWARTEKMFYTLHPK